MYCCWTAPSFQQDDVPAEIGENRRSRAGDEFFTGPGRNVVYEGKLRRMVTCVRLPDEAMCGRRFSCAGKSPPVGDTTRMQTLDALLYQWLRESDEVRIESAFRAYYSAAFPALVRHVQHRTGWDPAAAEDIAQEALLRFFDRAGRGRLEASALVKTELTRLDALRVGAPDSHRVALWGGDVEAFADSVSNFRLPSPDASVGADWRAAATGLAERIMPLQRRGWLLLDEAKRTVQRRLPADDDIAELDEREIAGFVRAAAQVSGLGFMASILTVIETLPRLRMPTNGFLFEIATTILLDDIKKRQRRKRGGLEERAGEHQTAGRRLPDESAHPVEAVPDDSYAELDDHPSRNRNQAPEQHWHAATGMSPPAIDPEARYESEELLERFYEYLRRPVARAVRALEEARGRGRGLAEQRRLESVSRKFSRTMSVLAMMGEGYTQDAAAQRVGLSRNQVKYIVESVKDAYVRFAAGEPGEPGPSVKREGESHVS